MRKTESSPDTATEIASPPERLDAYPGSCVPKLRDIVDHHGDSSEKDLMREILALTKMNVNNCAFADGRPITLSFSERIGEFLKHVLPNDPVLPDYKVYM